MRNYLITLVKVTLELAAFAVGVALLLGLAQLLGESYGTITLVGLLVLIVLLLAAIKARE